MKFTIKKITKVILCGALIIGTGCSDFLEEKDPSNIAPATFFQVPQDAEAAVYGIYENLRFLSDGAGIFVSNFQMIDALSGTADSETSQNQDLNTILGFTHTGDNLLISQWWRQLYEGIANANLAIDKIPGIPQIDNCRRSKMGRSCKIPPCTSLFLAGETLGRCPIDHNSNIGLEGPQRYGTTLLNRKCVST